MEKQSFGLEFTRMTSSLIGSTHSDSLTTKLRCMYYCLQQPGEMMFTSGPEWVLNFGSNINISINCFIEKIGKVGE